jgi:hypothetical protein
MRAFAAGANAGSGETWLHCHSVAYFCRDKTDDFGRSDAVSQTYETIYHRSNFVAKKSLRDIMRHK